MNAAKKLILISSILGTSLLVLGCTPNASSVSKALIHAQDSSDQNGNPPPIDNFNELNAQNSIKLLPVVKNDRNQALSILPENEQYIELSSDSKLFAAFTSLIKTGKSAPITIDPSPAQIVILINNDDDPLNFAANFQTGDCSLRLIPIKGTTWELSLGDDQPDCSSDRKEIQEVFIVPASQGDQHENKTNN